MKTLDDLKREVISSAPTGDYSNAIGGKDKDVISLNAVTAINEFLGEGK